MTHIEQAIKEAKRDYMREPQRWSWNVNGLEAWIISKGTVYIAVIGERDFFTVSKYRWYIKDGYAITSIGGKRIKMHHLILGKPPHGMVVDHRNRERMDNRRANLRTIMQRGNAKNMMGAGVRKHGKGWEAAICHDYKQIYLGTFPTKAEARAAYMAAKQTQLEAI